MTSPLDQLTPPEQALGRLAVELHVLDANSLSQAASLVMQRRVSGDAIGLDQVLVATGMLQVEQVKVLLKRAQNGGSTPARSALGPTQAAHTSTPQPGGGPTPSASSGQVPSVGSGHVPSIAAGNSQGPAIGSGSHRAVTSGARPGGSGMGSTRTPAMPLTPGGTQRSPSGNVPAYKSHPALAAVAPPPPPPMTSPAHAEATPRSAEPVDGNGSRNGLLPSAATLNAAPHAAPTMTMMDSPEVPRTAAIRDGDATLNDDPRLSEVAERMGVDVASARRIISQPTLAFPMTQSGGASSTGSGSGAALSSSSASALPSVGIDVNVFAQAPVAGAPTRSIADIAQRTVDLPNDDDDEALAEAKQQGMPNLASDTNPARRYTIGKPIARGGMGAILSALDPYLRRQVAIKVMLPAARAKKDRVERFLEEAQVTGQLEHPNIVPVHELGLDPSGAPYFTMKLVKGKSLAEVLRGLRREQDKGVQPGQVLRDDKGKVRRSYTDEYSLARLLQIFLKICDAIGFAHSKGVVHRDIKPDNLMLGSHGEVLVMDWGLAKVLKLDESTRKRLGRVGHSTTRRRSDGSRTGVNAAIDEQPADASVITDRSQTGSRTIDGAIAGTPAYMAPEQALGEIDRIGVHTDIYSLGAILYELLTLHAPFEGSVPQILKGVAQGELIPPSRRAPERRIPQELEAVVMKAMALRPQQRYAFASALADDVLAYLEGRAVSAAQYSRAQAAGLWLRRNKMAAVAAAAGVLALIAGAVLVAFVNKQAEAGRVQELVREGDRALDEGEVQAAYEKFLQAYALDSSLKGISDRIAEASQQVAERERRARAREIIAEADALFDRSDFAAAYRKYVAAQAQAPDIFSEEQQRRLYRTREFQDRLTLIAQARTRLAEAEQAFEDADFAGAYTAYLAVYGTAPELMGEAEERHMQVASAFVGRDLVDAENQLRGRELYEQAQQLMDDGRFGDAHERLLQAAAFCPGDVEILDLLVVAQQFKRATESEDLIQELFAKGERDTQAVSMQIAPLVAEWERIRNIRGINAAYTITQQAIEREKLEASLAEFRTQLELAIETFRQILLINPRDPRPYDRIAGAYMLMFSMARLIGDETAMDEVRARMRALGDGEWYEVHRQNLEFRTTLVVNTQPAAANIYAFRFERCHDGRRVPVPADRMGAVVFDAMDPRAPVTATLAEWNETGTIYRLPCTAANFIGRTPNARIDGLLTGSYLLILKAQGYADVRYPVYLEPGRPVVTPVIRLLRPNEIPEGFEYVAPGSYIRGGDAEVAGARASERVVVQRGFLMQREEVTLGDLVPFIEAYVQQHGVEIARQCVPRFQGTPFMEVTDAGVVWLSPERRDWPAMGQAYWGVERYLQWRSGLDGHTYRLPSDLEWEYAARGPDERLYPWGDRFHPGWAVMRDTYEDPQPQPVMRARREVLFDESPFGIRDMAGGAAEWCSDLIDGERVAPNTHVIRAGGNNYPAFYCRVTYRWGAPGDVYAPTVAFRMVLDLP